MDNCAKTEIIIRPYREEDAQGVRGICLETSTGPLREHPKMLFAAFCDYYIEQEPHNCFVAATAQGQVAGYILCAENGEHWAKVFREKYIEPAPVEAMRQFLEYTCATPLRYAGEYPAHLHIDLSPQFQRMGLGTRLMDALTAHLRSKGVPGLMLSVASDNEKGFRFYKKYGFTIMAEQPNEIVMGLLLCGVNRE